MYQSSLHLIFAFALTVSTYRLTFGQRSIIPKDVDLSNKVRSDNNQSISSDKTMMIFPYDVYRYVSQSGGKHPNTNFLLLKHQFQDIEQILYDYNSTLVENELEILYQTLPKVISIQSQQNEFVELEVLSPEVQNKKFVIKNGTYENGEMPSKLDLNFYSLEIHNYLLKIIKRGQVILHSNSTENKHLKEYYYQKYNISVNSSLLIDNEIKQRFVIEKMLTTQDSFLKNQENFYFLLQKVMTRTINNRTKWTAFFDGFNLVYFSAQIAQATTEAGIQQTIELTNVIQGSTEVKRSQVVRQPLQFLSIRSIEFIDLCSVNSKTTLLLSDRRRGYLIDITSLEWRILRYLKRQQSDIQSVFFNSECHLFAVQKSPRLIQEGVDNLTYINKQNSQTQIFQEYPLKGRKILQINRRYERTYSLHGLLILCWQNQDCNLFQTQNFSDILKDYPNQTLPSLKNLIPRYRLRLSDKAIAKEIHYYNLSGRLQSLLELQNLRLDENNTLVDLKRMVYSSNVYFNDIKYIGYEMDRVIYQRISSNGRNKDIETELFQANPIEPCFNQQPVSLSEDKFTFNSSGQWNVCSVDRSTKRYLSLKLAFPQEFVSTYQAYLCSAFWGINSSPTFTDCTVLIEGFPAHIDKLEYVRPLRANYYYKIYLVKNSKAQGFNLPTVFIKDIQKQQVQIASTIFVFLMIFFCFILVAIVLFYLLKYVIYNILVYYGYVNSRVEPTYPLGWFALEIRLKRLRQIGVLTFTRYERSFTDTEGNHCCFCLEELHHKTQIAQIYCGHEFHRSCFSDWMKNEPHAKCPTCRRPFTAAGLTEYQNSAGSNQELPL